MKNYYYSNLINLFIFIIIINKFSSQILPKRILINGKTNIDNNNISNYTKNGSNRNLINNESEIGNGTNLNNTDNITEDSYISMIKKDPGFYLLGWFLIFFTMGCYMVCKMKEYEQTRDKTDLVWKFMFMANNGTLLAAGINIFDIHNMYIDSSPFLLGTLVFIIGGICYLRKFISECNASYAELYFQSNPFQYWCNIPCFIWTLIGLTDPCCRSETYTVTTYADGHTESTYCCNVMWNCFIKVIKRLAFFFTAISYYIFILFVMIFWYLIKLLYFLLKGCCIKNQEIVNNNKNNCVPNYENQQNINVNNNNIVNYNRSNYYIPNNQNWNMNNNYVENAIQFNNGNIIQINQGIPWVNSPIGQNIVNDSSN